MFLVTPLLVLQLDDNTFIKPYYPLVNFPPLNSQPGKHHPAPFSIKHESSSMELVSPRIKPDNHATTAQGGYSFQSNWAVSGCVEMPEVGVRKVDGYENNMVLDPSQGGDILLIDFFFKKISFSFLPPYY